MRKKKKKKCEDFCEMPLNYENTNTLSMITMKKICYSLRNSMRNEKTAREAEKPYREHKVAKVTKLQLLTVYAEAI